MLFSGQPSSDNTSAVGSLIVSAALGDEEIVNLTEHQRIRTVFFVNQVKMWSLVIETFKNLLCSCQCWFFHLNATHLYYNFSS